MADSGVRQRKVPVEKATPSAPAANAGLEPDWAFVFARTDKSLQKHVGQALATLSDLGFYVTVRNGAKNSVVVLARAGGGLVAGSSTRAIGVSRRVPTLAGVVDNFPVETAAAPALLSAQPLLSDTQIAAIEQHYGGGVAALYAFTTYLQRSLVVPAVLGVATHFTVGKYSLAYSLAVLVWGALFVSKWQNVIEPDTGAASSETTRRAAFRGTLPKTREGRKLLFLPVAIVLLVIYALGLLAVLGLEVFMTQMYGGPLRPLAALVPIGANVAASVVYGVVYGWIIRKFTDWEDYPTEDEAHEVKTQRTFYLNILLGYLPILLSAFVYLPFGNGLLARTPQLRRTRIANFVRVAPDFKFDADRLQGQAVFYSVQNQIISLVVGAGLPSALYAVKRFVLKQAAPADADSFALQQLHAPFDIDSQISTLVLAFGYILLLAPVWPFAALAGLVGVYFRSKGSLFMLTSGTRKCVSRRGRTLGFWNRDLTFVVTFASIVAPAIAVKFGRRTYAASLLRGRPTVVDVPEFVLAAVALFSENFVLALKYVANNYFRLLRSADGGAARAAWRHSGVVDTPEQDRAWREIDVTADLRRVFPDASN